MSVDLKTLTPGTAASSSVLVGATSAAAASPSLFTTTGSGNVVLSASPTLTGNTVVSSGSFGLSGDISSSAWTTSGIRYANVAATLTDTSSTGTVATAYTDVFGGNTIAASNATTFTNYYTAWVGAPTAGTNVTFTGKWALGLGGSLQINGGTVTTNTTPALDISQTWNAGAVTFTGLKFNVTDTASASGSLLLDIGVGGGSYSSKFSVNKSGDVYAGRAIVASGATGGSPSSGALYLGGNTPSATNYSVLRFSNSLYLNADTSSDNIFFAGGNTNYARLSSTQFQLASNTQSITWGSINSTQNAFFYSPTGATFQFGAADAASPVAQTLQVQSVVAGTTNTAGANFTIAGSKGTGNAAGGSIIFQVAPAGSSGTAVNALATALTIAATKVITVSDTYDLAFSGTTGTKIGTATTQKIGFWNATPAVQPTAVADATNGTDVITQLNALLSRMRTIGLIAT